MKPRGLTVIHVGQDVDPGGGELGAQAAAHGHAEGDIEALLGLVERVIDDDHAARLLRLVLVESHHAVVLLRPGDVVRVGEHGRWHCPCSRP